MKRKIGIVVDSTFGLSEKYIKDQKISVVPLKVIIDQKEYVDGTINPQVIVDALHQKLDVKTSQPAPDQFIEAYTEQLKTFESVICMTISKTLSGTINSARLAKDILGNDNIHVIDSESNIMGSAYLTEKLIDFIDEGNALKASLEYLEQMKNQGSIVFTVDNLQTLVKNGRLSKMQAMIGNILKIKPILRFRKGVLDLEHKVRSFKNVILYLVEESIKLKEFGKVIVRIGYVDQSIGAKELEHEIFQANPDVDIKIVGVISPVVSAHVGLGGLGIYLAYE
jgi:DegV family protein with EDD domain